MAVIVDTLNASFPSGHALLSTVFYLTLGVMLTRAFPKRRLKAFVLGSALLREPALGRTLVDRHEIRHLQPIARIDLAIEDIAGLVAPRHDQHPQVPGDGSMQTQRLPSRPCIGPRRR